MTPTEDNTVRRCEQCKEDVHYCATIVEARDHAQQGHCVAVDLGIIRHEGDLDPPMMMLGRPAPDWYEREQERLEVDAVSREREEQKRQQGADEAKPPK